MYEGLLALAKRLYQAKIEELYARLLAQEGIGDYPWYDFSKNARQARAKRKALWKANHQEFERLAGETIIKYLDRLPDSILSPIMKELRGPDFVLRRALPKCSLCASEIPRSDHAIAEDLRRGGGIVLGGKGLDETLYEGLFCRSCGRIYCLNCHDPLQKGHSCPHCGNTLSPLFADFLRAEEEAL